VADVNGRVEHNASFGSELELHLYPTLRIPTAVWNEVE